MSKRSAKASRTKTLSQHPSKICLAGYLYHPTRQQSAAIARVSPSIVARAKCPQRPQPPSDAEIIERIVRKLGPACVREIIDQMTAPMSVAAE